jgi:hypothetical protein
MDPGEHEEFVASGLILLNPKLGMTPKIQGLVPQLCYGRLNQGV